MARGWKRPVERIVARSGLAGALRSSNQPTAAVLAYHNIVPGGERVVGDVSLHVPQRTFAEHLDFLLETHDVVPLASLDGADAEAGSAGRGRPRAAVTFDDAYVGALTAGVEELRARGLPATVFVPPGLLGAPGFWWDVLAPAGGNPLPATVRVHALQVLEGRQERVLEWAAAHDLPFLELPPHARPADERALLDTAGAPGVTLGAHTWSHPNLARAGPDAARSEMDRSKSWLHARTPAYIDWLAYPYGLQNAQVVIEAEERFAGAVLIDGGLARIRGRWTTSPHRMPRLNVPHGLTTDGLGLRLSGLRR